MTSEGAWRGASTASSFRLSGPASPRETPPGRSSIVEGKVSLAAPIAGVVEDVNDRLRRNPTLVNRDPYGAGLGCLPGAPRPRRARHPESPSPRTRATAPWIAAESERLSRHLAHAVGSHWTLPDGGRMIDDLHEAIPPDVRGQVLEPFLSANPSRPVGLLEDRTARQKGEREGR